MKAADLDPWLLAFMIGDAYGAGFEMRPPEYVEEHNDGLTYRAHGLDATHRPGMPTDDTQMMLAVKNAIEEASIGRWQFSQAFCDAYRRAPAPGYGRRMRERLPYALTQADPAAALIEISKHDATTQPLYDTCGAAMRALPCGVLLTDGAAVEAAYEQARVTHHHPDSIDAALAVTMIGMDYESGDTAMAHASAWVGWPHPEDWTPAQWQRGTTAGKDIVMAAFGLLSQEESLHKLLVKSVALGGDVDTLAALALGIGALFPGRWQYDLPKELEDGLIIPEAAWY